MNVRTFFLALSTSVKRYVGVDVLGDGYRVTRDDLVEALDQQGVELRDGDVVLIRTGRMKFYEDASAYMANSPPRRR